MQTSVTIVEHIDPESFTPSGIDNIIHGLIQGADDTHVFRIVGVTKDKARRLGQWVQIPFAGKHVSFLPVAHLDLSQKGSRWRIPHSLRFGMGLLRFSARFRKGDVWHTHRAETGLLCTRLLRLPVVQFIHNSALDLTGPHSDSQWSRISAVHHLVQRDICQQASSVIVFNRKEAERLRPLRPDLIRGQTWFDPDLFFPAASARCSSAPCRITWVGRLDGAKNPWWTLDLAKAAVEADEPIVINIVGSGPYAEPLQRAARAARLSNVHFLGPVRHDEVGDVLRQSDVYLITSHYEGSSTSLVEALATGLPCLVTPGADQDHLVQVGINGFHLWGDPVRDLELVRQARALPRGSIPQTVAHRSIDKLLPAYLGYGQ